MAVLYTHNDTKTGSAPDAYAGPITFDQRVSRVDIWIWDNAAIVKGSFDGTNFDDEIEIPANVAVSIDVCWLAFDIKNKTAGAVARYQVIGWF